MAMLQREESKLRGGYSHLSQRSVGTRIFCSRLGSPSTMMSAGARFSRCVESEGKHRHSPHPVVNVEELLARYKKTPWTYASIFERR